MTEEETQRLQAALAIMQDVVDRCPPKSGTAQTEGEQWRQRFTAWQIVVDLVKQTVEPPARAPMMQPVPEDNGTAPELVTSDG